jgi:hypothetical protein
MARKVWRRRSVGAGDLFRNNRGAVVLACTILPRLFCLRMPPVFPGLAVVDPAFGDDSTVLRSVVAAFWAPTCGISGTGTGGRRRLCPVLGAAGGLAGALVNNVRILRFLPVRAP